MFETERRNHFKTGVYDVGCAFWPVDTGSPADTLKKFEKGFKFEGFAVFLHSTGATPGQQAWKGELGISPDALARSSLPARIESRSPKPAYLPAPPSKTCSPAGSGSRLARPHVSVRQAGDESSRHHIESPQAELSRGASVGDGVKRHTLCSSTGSGVGMTGCLRMKLRGERRNEETAQ